MTLQWVSTSLVLGATTITSCVCSFLAGTSKRKGMDDRYHLLVAACYIHAPFRCLNRSTYLAILPLCIITDGFGILNAVLVEHRAGFQRLGSLSDYIEWHDFALGIWRSTVSSELAWGCHICRTSRKCLCHRLEEARKDPIVGRSSRETKDRSSQRPPTHLLSIVLLTRTVLHCPPALPTKARLGD